MKTVVSLAVSVCIAFMAIPHFKYESRELPPIENLRYEINTYQHKLDIQKMKTDSIRVDIIKNQQYIRNVVPGAD